MEYIVRPYQTGDAEKIYRFFSKNTHLVRDDAFWVWINRMITTDTFIQVIEFNGEIVGHYAALPFDFLINGSVIKGAQTLHIIIDEKHRDVVLLDKLMRQLYFQLNEQNICFTFGFPNPNMRPIAQHIDKVKQVAFFKSYELSKDEFVGKANVINKFTVTKIEQWSYNHYFNLNELLEISSNSSSVEIKKSVGYWANRYINHPQSLYSFHEVSVNNTLKGYIVAKKYIKEGYVYSHIIDYVFAPKVSTYSIIEAFMCSISDEVDMYSFWKGDKSFEDALLQIGFRAIGFETFLGVKILNKQLPDNLMISLLDYDNWRLVMGDSDAF